MTHPEERGGAETTARRAGEGFAWATLAVLGARALGFGGIAVLARILSPEHFGLLGFALAVLVYVEALGDLGTGAALVYWPRRQADAAQVTFATNLVLGLAWAGCGWLAAPLIGDFFDAADAVPVIRAMVWVVPIRFLGNTPDALLRRDMRFRERLVPEVGGSLVKLVVSVATALGGAGVWSLVAGQLAGQAVTTLLFWRAVDWRPGMGFPTDLPAPMFRYGSGIVAVNLLAALTHHADLIVVGRMLGATSLGLYQVAAKVPEVTILVLVWVVGKVLFPAFARLHAAGDELATVYLRALRYVAAAVIPSGIGLTLIAPAVVDVAFGAGWEGSVPILRGLAAYATVRALGSHAGDVLKGTGRTGLLAGLGVLKAAILIPVLVLAGSRGAGAIAWGLAAVAVVGGTLNVTVASRVAGFRLGAAARQLVPATIAAIPLVAWVLAGRALLPGPELLRLAVLVPIGAGLYLAALRVVDRRLVEEVLTTLRRQLADGDSSPRAEAAGARRALP